MKQSESLNQWRKNLKERMIASLGGKCQICGFDKFRSAFCFHHIDPKQKKFSICDSYSWKKLAPELKKCILLCNNCHSGIHSMDLEIPRVYQKFDESLAGFKEQYKEILYDNCPICSSPKPKHQKTCSVGCSRKIRTKGNWKSINLIESLEKLSIVEIGKRVGVSEAAVRKRIKKLGIKTEPKKYIDWIKIDLLKLKQKHTYRTLAEMFGVSTTTIKLHYKRAKSGVA